MYSLLPGLASLVLYMFLVRTAFYLKSATFKDINLLDEVQEEAKMVLELDDQVRARLLEKFEMFTHKMSDDEFLRAIEPKKDNLKQSVGKSLHRTALALSMMISVQSSSSMLLVVGRTPSGISSCLHW